MIYINKTIYQTLFRIRKQLYLKVVQVWSGWGQFVAMYSWVPYDLSQSGRWVVHGRLDGLFLGIKGTSGN